MCARHFSVTLRARVYRCNLFVLSLVSMFATVIKTLLVVSTLWSIGTVFVGVFWGAPGYSVTQQVQDTWEMVNTEIRIFFMDSEESKSLLMQNCMHLEYVANDASLHRQCYEWTRSASNTPDSTQYTQTEDGATIDNNTQASIIAPARCFVGFLGACVGMFLTRFV